jgi:hypothetical protein
VNSPGLVSTSIDPACCLTTMSWLMESPRPVPSPAGLVVKKGLNSFSLTSGEMSHLDRLRLCQSLREVWIIQADPPLCEIVNQLLIHPIGGA